MDLLHLVDRLEELIAEAQKMPIGNRVIIDRRRLLDLIDQMRISVPQEVREARELVADRDRILRDAEEESSIIVGRAEESAERLVEAHSITEAARERAQEIADEAEHRLTQRVEQANDDIQIRIEESRDLARQQMQAADSYALELLQRLDRQLQAFVGSVQAGIHQVEPERELPPAPYPGEFDPGPPAPGNFRSEDALGSLPEDDRVAEELTLTRHELPAMDIPAVALPDPDPESEPAPVVMAEPEPEPLLEELPPIEEQPAPVEEAPASTSRFGNSVWGRSAEPEPESPAPVAEEPPAAAPRSGFASSVWGRSAAEETTAEVDEPEAVEQIAARFDSPVDAQPDDTLEQSPAAEPEPEPEPQSSGGGPFSSLFNRPAADTPPPPATTSSSTATTGGPAASPGTNLPGDSGRLPGVGSVPPPAPTGSRFGLFGRREQSTTEVDTDVAPAAEAAEANGDTSDQPASDQPTPSTGFGSSLGRATDTPSNGGFEDLLAQARETADPVPAVLDEVLGEQSDSDEPAAVIDDFDNPPLDDDPLLGDAPEDANNDGPRPPSTY